MVGKIRLVFDDLTTHRSGSETRRAYPAPGIPVARGAEWGHFEFGSTLVLVGAADAFAFSVCPPGTRLRLGEDIGRLRVAR